MAILLESSWHIWGRRGDIAQGQVAPSGDGEMAHLGTERWHRAGGGRHIAEAARPGDGRLPGPAGVTARGGDPGPGRAGAPGSAHDTAARGPVRANPP